MKRESDAPRGDSRDVIGSDRIRKKKKRHDERDDQSAYRALPVKNFQAEIGKREQPSKQRHRTRKIVVRNGVQAARAFKKRVIVSDKAGRQQQGGDSPGPFVASYKIAHVAGKTAEIRRKCKQEKEMIHELGPDDTRPEDE